MKKRLSLLILLSMLMLAILSGCYYSYSINGNSVALPDSDTYYDSEMPYHGDYNDYFDDYYGDYYDDYYDENDNYMNNEISKAIGNIVIVVFGYVLPLVLIVLSLIFYFKSNSSRRSAWFIMTGVGLATAILITLLLLLTM